MTNLKSKQMCDLLTPVVSYIALIPSHLVDVDQFKAPDLFPQSNIWIFESELIFLYNAKYVCVWFSIYWCQHIHFNIHFNIHTQSTVLLLIIIKDISCLTQMSPLWFYFSLFWGSILSNSWQNPSIDIALFKVILLRQLYCYEVNFR